MAVLTLMWQANSDTSSPLAYMTFTNSRFSVTFIVLGICFLPWREPSIQSEMVVCSHNNHTTVVPRDLSFQAGYYDSLQVLQLSKTIGDFSSLAAYMTLPSIVKTTQQ